MSRRIVLFGLVLLFMAAAPRACTADVSRFQQAREAYKDKNYAMAITFLKEETIDKTALLHDYALFTLAQSYAALNQFPPALDTFRELVMQHPTSRLKTRARLRMLVLYKKMGDTNNLEREGGLLVQDLSANPTELTLFELGEVYQHLAQPRRAMEAYVRLRAHYPESPYAQPALEELQKIKKQYGIAPRLLTADEMWGRGNFYFDIRDFPRARDNYRQFIQTYPRDTRAGEALLQLADIYYRTGKYNSARSAVNQARSRGGNAADGGLYWIGMIAGRRGDPATADGYFSKLISENPQHGLADDAQFRIAYFYDINDQFGSAERAYRDFLKKFPQSDLGDDVVWRLGWLQYKQGRMGDARETFTQAYERYPKGDLTPYGLFWEAKVWEKEGRGVIAQQAYKILARDFPLTYYGYKSKIRLAELSNQPSPIPQTDHASAPSLPSSGLSKFETLLALGLYDDALVEARGYAYSQNAADQAQGKLAVSRWYALQGKPNRAILVLEGEYKRHVEEGQPFNYPDAALSYVFPLGYADYVFRAAREFDIDPYLMFALIREESRFNAGAHSYAAAHGLTQIIPSTGRKIAGWLGIRPYSTRRLLEPALNVRMGTYYLSKRLREFNGEKALALAAYNGGAHNVNKWLKEYGYDDPDEFVEHIPFFQTRYYVKSVLRSYYEYKRIYGAAGPTALYSFHERAGQTRR